MNDARPPHPNTDTAQGGSFGARLGRRLRRISSFAARPATVLRGYDRADLRPDLLAGLTVAVIMLPQAIAFAMIAELPLEMGIYAAITASIVGALWSSSKHLNVGPTNVVSLLVLASLLTVAEPGTPEFIAAAGLMAVMVGLLQLTMGLLRLGVLVNFVADSVVLGFTAGAGVLIFFNQARHLLRLDLSSHPEFAQTVAAIFVHMRETHLISLGLGALTAFIIVALKKWRPQCPAGLCGMAAAAAVTAIFDLQDAGVAVLGALPRGLPPFSPVPLLDLDLLGTLSAGALAVGAIGLVETVSISRGIAARSGQRLDSDQEFVGQGMSNLAAGLFSGYAVAGSFTRSAVNHEAGARTSMSGLFAGLWALAALFLLAPLVAYLPRASVAGLLMVTAWQLIDRREMRRILRSSKGDSSILLATLAATLLLPLEFAVLGGMLVSFSRYLIKSSTPGVHPVVPDENFRHFVRAGDRPVCPQLGIIRIEGSLYFGAVNHVEDVIRANQDAHPEQTFLLLRMGMVDHCDVSGIHMLESVMRQYRKEGGDLFLEGVRPMARHMMNLYGFDRALGPDNMLGRDDTVSHLFHKKLNPGICVYECPVRVFAECQALPKDEDVLMLPDRADVPDHNVEELAPSEVRTLLDDGAAHVMVIDVGEEHEYDNWHIPGARCLSLPRLAEKGTELPYDATVVFVSRIGRRSALAVTIMQDLGHQRTFSLRGGMLAWEAAGYPIAVE
ncbi:MAG: STAS domain-containing protein [bacterium]|nr:STAS domain-containing protein [bacterium]